LFRANPAVEWTTAAEIDLENPRCVPVRDDGRLPSDPQVERSGGGCQTVLKPTLASPMNCTAPVGDRVSR
jgi:hypothetical protein